jgi:catechol 2,3-dioxygenase-like lactoylglutathione lyase family enzyme
MVAIPLAHISWAIFDNADRPACDAFFSDIFGAEPVFEMIETPETAHLHFDREERLMVIGDTMLIPIAAAAGGLSPTSPTGEMLRRNAGANRWLGLALFVEDLPSADAWMQARGFKLHYDPGMENHYFLIGRKQAMGLRLELLRGPLPNDPRLKAGWDASRWASDHPLGIEGLQSIGVSVPSLAAARELFAQRLDWPEISHRQLPGDDADCASFDLGDSVIEAMAPLGEVSPLARHLRETQGIYCLTFKVRDAGAAADYLRGKGLSLIGDVAGRFAIDPADAHGRLIYFTQHTMEGHPPLGSKMPARAVFPPPS